MDWGAFAGGMGNALSAGSGGLKKLMTKTPEAAPGYEDPLQQMSVAGPADFLPATQAKTGNVGSFIEQLLKMLQASGGY